MTKIAFLAAPPLTIDIGGHAYTLSAKVQPLKTSYISKRDDAYARAVAVLGSDAIADPTDPDTKDDSEALCAALLDHGVPLHRKVKSCDHGSGCDCPFTTNKFALQEFAKDFPVIADLQGYRTAAKFLSTDSFFGRITMVLCLLIFCEGRDVSVPVAGRFEIND